MADKADAGRGLEDEVTRAMLRITAKLLNTARAVVVGLVVIIGGGTAWVTRVDLTLNSIENGMSDVTVRIKSLESLVGEGILARADAIVTEHERRIDGLERELVRLSGKLPDG